MLTGCETVKFQKVLNTEEYILVLELKSIFKPINSNSSSGIKVIDYNQQIQNEYYKKCIFESNVMSHCHIFSEIKDYFDSSIIGIIEEYIDPLSIKVSVDGFISNKNINHYCISENVYYSDKCEEFNYLVTPCQSINDNEIQKCWELYDKVIKQLINRGLNNQFCDIEMFVIRDRNKFQVKVMEINCRAFSNQLPIFSMLYKENSMFNIAQKLLFKDDVSILKDLKENNLIGICL